MSKLALSFLLALALRGRPYSGSSRAIPLRVYGYTPQSDAPSIHEGLEANILVQDLPGQKFDGTVTRTAGALDPQSRAMQVEVQVPNHENKLYAGMYGHVKFILLNVIAPIIGRDFGGNRRCSTAWSRTRNRHESHGRSAGRHSSARETSGET
jgi:hypothetical protein